MDTELKKSNCWFGFRFRFKVSSFWLSCGFLVCQV